MLECHGEFNKSITIFVNCNNASPTQNGKTWDRAYSSLQSALNKASNAYGKVYVCIAKGTYFPTEIYAPNGQVGGASGLNDIRLRTFNIPNNTTLIGGFNGTETHRKDCNAKENITVLSGLNKYWHVVTVGNDVNPNFKATCSLYNLIIQGGNAKGKSGSPILSGPFTYDHSNGGGLYITHGSSVKLVNVCIKNNNAGITDPTNPFITTGGLGGGIFCSNSNLVMSKCVISNNSSEFRSGGLQVLNSFEGEEHYTAVVKDCLFSNNVAVLYGGAMHTEGISPNKLSNILVESSEFKSNTAQVGGVIDIVNHTVTFECCNFNDNFSPIAAGGLSTLNIFTAQSTGVKGVVNVNNSTFTNNVTAGDHQLLSEQVTGSDTPKSRQGGGACYVTLDGILNISNSTFNSNTVRQGDGGALLNEDPRLIVNKSVVNTVSNCKFLNNSTLYGNGGAIASVGDNASKLVIRDTKFKCNSAPNGKGDNVYDSKS